MFEKLLNIFKHECKFMVLGVMEATSGNERICYGIGICTHIFCREKIYFPQECRTVHKQWIREGKNISTNFEENMFRNIDY